MVGTEELSVVCLFVYLLIYWFFPKSLNKYVTVSTLDIGINQWNVFLSEELFLIGK